MPVYLDDPSVLTKERLKSELRAHNVELPVGNPTKDVYVQLYVKTVSAQSHGTEALDAFSSDEELPPPLVSQTRRSRSSGRKSEVALERLDMAEMSDEDLREQLLKQGVHAGPIVDSTRKLYERKLLKLLDNEVVQSESQSHSSSGDAEVYSDQEEDVPVAPEPDLTADVELEPVPVKSNSSHTPSVQRHSSSQHSITKQVEQVEKMTAEEDTALPELPTFTGLTVMCRQPIKGAAGVPLKHDTTYSFESSCNSASTTANSAPFIKSSTPPAPSSASIKASSAPSTASSASSSASSASSAACQAKACGMSWWKKLLLLVVLLMFVYLVYQAMEPNGAAPTEQGEL